jgi:hypothetical protein
MAIVSTVDLLGLALSSSGAITTNTTTAGAILDTAQFEMGITYFMGCPARTDGTYKLLLEWGDNSALSDAVAVPAANLLVTTGANPVTTGITAATASGGEFLKVGVICGDKRYIRASVVSTGVTSGATISVLCARSSECLPQ